MILAEYVDSYMETLLPPADAADDPAEINERPTAEQIEQARDALQDQQPPGRV